MSGTQAVDRAADLLVRVLDARRALAFGELTESAGLAKSTTSRLLSALEGHGLVARDPDGAVVPGPAVVRYARAFDGAATLVDDVRPVLERVVSLTGETANLAVANGGSVLLVDQVDGTFLLGAVNWVGREVPPHASALGKVLIAHGLLPFPVEPLTALTTRTLISVPALQREIARVRRVGYAVIRDELEIGLTAVAVPVRDADGIVVAAVSLSGPTARLDERRARHVAGLLLDQFAPTRPLRGGAA